MASARDRLLAARKQNKENATISSETNLIDEIVEETPNPIEVDIPEPRTEPIIEPKEEPKMYYNSDTIPLHFKAKKKHTKEKIFSARLYPEIYNTLCQLAEENELSINEALNQLLAQTFGIDIDFK